MTNDDFNDLIEDLIKTASNTLHKKNSAYAFDSSDPLENFNVGSDIAGMTPPQTCWGYLTKHLAALRGMIDRNDFSDIDDFKEKCQDSINYILLLWCLGNEQHNLKLNEQMAAQEDEKTIIHKPPYVTLRTTDEGHFFQIVLGSLVEAERALDDMNDAIANYKRFSVDDMYSFAGIPSSKYPYSKTGYIFKYGWTNIDRVSIMKVHDGYSIMMPEPAPVY